MQGPFVYLLRRANLNDKSGYNAGDAVCITGEIDGKPPGPAAQKLTRTSRRPRRDVQRFVFQPVALLARLWAPIPPPYFNLVRYFGPLSSAFPVPPRADCRAPNRPRAAPAHDAC